MKLFHISQTENNDWDTYDSAVVAAFSEEDARNITPNGSPFTEQYSSWCSSPDKVNVVYLGEAGEGTTHGVICASFNAG